MHPVLYRLDTRWAGKDRDQTSRGGALTHCHESDGRGDAIWFEQFGLPQDIVRGDATQPASNGGPTPLRAGIQRDRARGGGSARSPWINATTSGPGSNTKLRRASTKGTWPDKL